MIDYKHPRRANVALVAAPVTRTSPVVLQRGETIILTGPRAGTIERR